MTQRQNRYTKLDGFMRDDWAAAFLDYANGRVGELVDVHGYNVHEPGAHNTGGPQTCGHLYFEDDDPFLDGLMQAALANFEFACAQCGVEPFGIADFEAKLTLRWANQRFDWHSDHRADGTPETRALSFTYNVHKTPRLFRGGELEFYDVEEPVDPTHNSAVFFAPYQVHRVQPVLGVPQSHSAFGRWTFVGWFHAHEPVEPALTLPPSTPHPFLSSTLARKRVFSDR